MATYRVKLGTNDGILSTRQVHGHNPTEVRRQLQAEGFHVFNVKPVFNLASLFGARKRVGHSSFLLFNKEFRGLIKAGMPIVEGLDILLKRMKPGRLRSLIEGVRAKLSAGESLSASFRAFQDLIPAYYPALLDAGEQSGNLVEVLERFIHQEDRLRKIRKKFMQSLTYPAILLVVSMISMYVILVKAMPQFTSMYQGSKQQLPLVTRIVMGASDFLIEGYPFLFGGMIVLVVSAHFYARSERGARRLERILLRLPLLGKIWSLQTQNVFARTMRMLLGGGITVPQALAITANALPSPSGREQMRRVYLDVLQGGSLQDALEKNSQMEDMVIEMIHVGETTGSLCDMLDYLAEAGEERAEDYLELISNLVAPVMLVGVGLAIGVMVVAMYLPMFGSYNAIGI